MYIPHLFIRTILAVLTPALIMRLLPAKLQTRIWPFWPAEGVRGAGAVLNTSFNLHGEPIVYSPADAIEVFVRSGLTHLALNHFLVSKRPGG